MAEMGCFWKRLNLLWLLSWLEDLVSGTNQLPCTSQLELGWVLGWVEVDFDCGNKIASYFVYQQFLFAKGASYRIFKYFAVLDSQECDWKI